MSTKVRLEISYDGTEYGGWQRQKKSDRPTIQETVESSLSQLFNEPIRVVGSGRTDAGVHAISQVCHFVTSKDPKKFNIIRALNGRWTPDSIVYKAAYEAPMDFHALASADRKTYKYLLQSSSLPSALRRNYMHRTHYPLDLEYLNQIAQAFVGEHDFASFQTSGTEVKSTVRRIFSAQWRQVEPTVFEMTISGNGFLRQMVRNIVGIHLYMSRNASKIDLVQKVLAARDRQAAFDTAPPNGLYLYRVEYPEELDKRCRRL